MTLRRLSQLLALGLMALTFAAMAQPKIVGDQYVVEILISFLVAILVVFGAAFLFLRWAAGGSAIHWSTDRNDQVAPVVWMIAAMLAMMFACAEGLLLLGRLDRHSSYAAYILSGVVVLSASVWMGWVKWPRRLARPKLAWLILLTVIGLAVATAFSFAVWSMHSETSTLTLTLDRVSFLAPAVLAGATIEEVMFRVLLLTALLDRTGSRFQAVFL